MSPERLTPRQEQIADGIRRGLSYAEIAGELTRVNRQRISPHTVRVHVIAMAAKLRPLLVLDDDADRAAFPPHTVITIWIQQTRTLKH